MNHSQESYNSHKIIFVNPFQDQETATHSYDNIQSAYTYITRHWKCTRKRAKDIYHAVSQGVDISTWPESQHAILRANNDYKYSDSSSISSSGLTLESTEEDFVKVDISENDKFIETKISQLHDDLKAMKSDIGLILTMLTNLSESTVPSTQILTSVAKGTALGVGESMISLRESTRFR